MHEHIHPITDSSHLDLQKGALYVFKETPSDYLPVKTYGRLLEAVIGGAPDVYFPIWPNRSQIGYIKPAPNLPFSAWTFEQKIEEGVIRPEQPFAIGRWDPEIVNPQGGRILHLFVKTDDIYQMYTMTWESPLWKILTKNSMNERDIERGDPELLSALHTLQAIG